MKFEEALAAIKQGRKLRRPNWDEESYMFLRDNELIILNTWWDGTPVETNMDYEIQSEDLLAEDWEIVE